MRRIITFGTFDLLHIGHIELLKRAKRHGDWLIVGVSTDKMNFDKKNFYPVYNQDDRAEIIRSIRYVDEVFFEESLEEKINYIKHFNAHALIMGNDWEGKFDFCKEACEVIYLSRTPKISTTHAKNTIINRNL